MKPGLNFLARQGRGVRFHGQRAGRRWYRLEVRGLGGGQAAVEASVEHVGVGEVFIVAGQSNAGNYGSERQSVKTGHVASFNGVQWALADDPQGGADGSGGSFIPAFGDAMNMRFHVPIGVEGLPPAARASASGCPRASECDSRRPPGQT